MRTELSWFGELEPYEREVCRKHFLDIGVNSNYYSSLVEAVKGSIDWENVQPHTPDYFFFHYLISELEVSGAKKL